MIKLTTEEKRERDRVRVANKRLKYTDKDRERVAKVTKAYRMANLEKKRAYNRAYNKKRYDNDPVAEKVRAAEYRAKRIKATPKLTKKEKKEIVGLYKIAQDATKLFGYGWEVDHIVPLAKGGLHNLANLQVVPAKWNRIKSASNSDLYWG